MFFVTKKCRIYAACGVSQTPIREYVREVTYYGTKGNKIRFLATALDGSGVKKIVTVKVK